MKVVLCTSPETAEDRKSFALPLRKAHFKEILCVETLYIKTFVTSQLQLKAFWKTLEMYSEAA